jgi:hypothetical protein
MPQVLEILAGWSLEKGQGCRPSFALGGGVFASRREEEHFEASGQWERRQTSEEERKRAWVQSSVVGVSES